MTTDNCVLHLLPVNLQKLDIYNRVNELICNQDELFSDNDILDYLTRAGTIVRTSLSPNAHEITWDSPLTWEETIDATWNDPNTYTSSTIDSNPMSDEFELFKLYQDIAIVNGGAISETGFQFWEHFITPYIGTNIVQRVLLDSLRIEGKVNDWYDNFTAVNTYDFVIDEFPGWDKAGILIEGSRLLKNAESKLTSLKDTNCVPRLQLSDGGRLDNELLSDIATEDYKGVKICFQHFNSNFLNVSDDDIVSFDVLSETAKQLFYWETQTLSHNLYLDEPAANKLYRTNTPERLGKFVQMLPAYLWGDGWAPEVTWESHVSWVGPLIEGLVRLEIGKTSIIWTPTLTWTDDLEWAGDPTDWYYNKPCTLNDCIEDRNFIPGFGPSDGASLYNLIVFGTQTTTNIDDEVWANDGNTNEVDGNLGLFDGNID